MTAFRNAKDNQFFYLQSVRASTLPLAEKLLESDDPEAIYNGLVLSETVDSDNLFIADGMTTKSGESFVGRGNLVGSSSRLCRFYLQRRAKQSRLEIQSYLSNVELNANERWRFLTLTMPRLFGLPFADVSGVFDDALKYLRNDKKFWKKIRLGVRSKEFTLGKIFERENRNWSLFDDGFHIHAHMIIASKWLENRKGLNNRGEVYFREIAAAWKKALLKSGRKNGVTFEFNSGDELPIVDLRLVTNRKTYSNDEISLRDAINECSKYICKPDEIERLPIEQIIEVNAYLKGKRMIEPLGEINKRKGKGIAKECVVDALGADPMFSEDTDECNEHATSIFNNETIEKKGMHKTRCIELIRSGSVDLVRDLIRLKFEKHRIFRRKQLACMYPDAEFMTLSGEVFSFNEYLSESEE